jgi:V/A-type H+/Na+-transporting ATPase subunit E
MALSDLLAGLQAEAAAEEAELEAETRAEVTRIGEQAQAEARLLREQALQADEDELRREAEALRARARLAAAAAVRQAREDAFHELIAEVGGRLEALRESASYPGLLRALLRESLSALPAATSLRVDSRDERLAADLVAELDAELQIVATLETAGGVELTRGGDRAVRNTVEDRLANAEPTLRLLFGRAQHVEAP